MFNLAKELRVMHACELGAIGVYRGHKCAARYFFRSTMQELDSMRHHEREHADLFSKLLSDRGFRHCYFSFLWFWGGLFYGVFIGVLGLKAIGRSTATIEAIVDIELDKVLNKLKDSQDIYSVLLKVQKDERSHQSQGEFFARGDFAGNAYITNLATTAAYAAKNIAEVF